MKKSFLSAIFLFFSLINISFAQGIFKVIASSGSNSRAGVALKIGAQIASTDKVVVGDKSYLGLSYAKGGTVQISKAGTYSAADLEKKLLATTKSASQKYADFIIGEVVKNGDANIHKNPYAYQNVTGSVERSMYGIKVYLPNNTYFSQDKYTFSWKAMSGVTHYVLEFYNAFEELIKKETVEATSYTIDMNAKEFAEQELIKVKVMPKNIKLEKIPAFSFNRDDTKQKKFNEKFAKIKKELGEGFEENPSKLIELALFLEENEMYIDAQQAYEKATKLEPQNEAWAIAFKQFLIRQNIEQEESASKE